MIESGDAEGIRIENPKVRLSIKEKIIRFFYYRSKYVKSVKYTITGPKKFSGTYYIKEYVNIRNKRTEMLHTSKDGIYTINSKGVASQFMFYYFGHRTSEQVWKNLIRKDMIKLIR